MSRGLLDGIESLLLRSRQPAEPWEPDPNDVVVIACRERGKRIAEASRRVELASTLASILNSDLLIETERAYGTASTRSSYKGHWKRWAAWCAEQGLAPLPSWPEAVAAYILTATANMRPAQAEKALSAIQYFNRWNSTPLDGDDAMIRAALRFRKRCEQEQQTETAATTAIDTEPKAANGSGVH